MKNNKYTKLTNLNLVTFLYVNNHQIAGINQINEMQKSFSFITSDALEELIWLYRFGCKDDERLLVNVHLYERGRKELLDLLKS